jgi:hypothetical protein
MMDELIIYIVQTILLVPVLPHGVLQIGSLEPVRIYSLLHVLAVMIVCIPVPTFAVLSSVASICDPPYTIKM